ncbi:NYN domain-containing protein [Dactylosporangium aurantiacum]|uniref:NYN domain-containing protein n=1 Tax=Dactylosporangium aurantiacum TaxID=35754 RepID=A0A9Q9MKT8_9ACTN|nr:hypothetical protein [Dactylosporangium aurantiacum]MDG6106198.1 NYN domain-containing protein [Dactylosporangium aurantiacum]UWZ58300.1 NYN domain-containing protein [Dactylosporangium aurantiacum]
MGILVRWVGRWPEWSGYAAAAWSLGYGLLGFFWSMGGDGFPFEPIDMAHVSGSVLEGSRTEIVAPIMAVCGALGTLAGLAMARGAGNGRGAKALVLFGWSMAVVLALVVPDYFLLALVAFAPLLLVFAFTGVPGPQDGLGDIVYWHRTNLVIMFVGGLLWAAATLSYQRKARKCCPHCGRGGGPGARPSRAASRRWGEWAVVVACLAPLPYEVTRIAWYLGYPLGITDDFLRMMRDTPGMLEVGLGAAVASALGGVLTHGLVRRWGEIYPRWIWWKAGRPVPPALAVVPASVVSVVLVPAGMMNLRMEVSRDMWALNAPGILYLVWGVALGAATIAYHLRRRGTCRRCGRGTTIVREAVRVAGPPAA